MRTLTLIMAYFDNAGQFAEQQRVWMSYPPEIRARLHVVVVDDASSKPHRLSRKRVTVDGLASLRLYRLLKKARWNWLACRNLGASVATTEWLLLTDMDHVLPVETLQRLLDGPLDPQNVYRFSRVDALRPWPYTLAECQSYKPHNDTWLLTKAMFDYDDGRKFVCGYDERLSGCYGSSGEFRDRLFACAKAHVQLPEVVIRYPREIIADASTLPSVYTRKNDPVNDDELQRRKEARAQDPHWRPKRGTFPSESVYSTLEAEVGAC